MNNRSDKTRKRVYVELVRSLYTTTLPTVIMSLGYVASFAIFAVESRDVVLAIFAAVGAFSGVARVAVLLYFGKEAASEKLHYRQARLIERIFAVSYIQFAVLLGVSGAYVLAAGAANFPILMICLLVGYGAGVAAGVGLRPRLAIASMLIAIVPSIAVLLLDREPTHLMTGLMMTALVIGGCQSLYGRFKVTAGEIGKRLTFEKLARRDSLTDLPNRLALKEWFEIQVTEGKGQQQLAVYCLDLDGFKPVNDVFGHPAGDRVLLEIGERLTRFIKPGDIAARLGGDEFAIIQLGIPDHETARVSAKQISTLVEQPFDIRGHSVNVACSIGYAICAAKGDLDDILETTDRALYKAKKTGAVETISVSPAPRAA